MAFGIGLRVAQYGIETAHTPITYCDMKILDHVISIRVKAWFGSCADEI